jgi:hypothetical protein
VIELGLKSAVLSVEQAPKRAVRCQPSISRGVEPDYGHSQSAVSLDLTPLEFRKLALKGSAVLLKGTGFRFLKLLAWRDARIVSTPPRAMPIFPDDSFSCVIRVSGCNFEKFPGKVNDMHEASELSCLPSVRIAGHRYGFHDKPDLLAAWAQKFRQKIAVIGFIYRGRDRRFIPPICGLDFGL